MYASACYRFLEAAELRSGVLVKDHNAISLMPKYGANRSQSPLTCYICKHKTNVYTEHTLYTRDSTANRAIDDSYIYACLSCSSMLFNVATTAEWREFVNRIYSNELKLISRTRAIDVLGIRRFATTRYAAELHRLFNYEKQEVRKLIILSNYTDVKSISHAIYVLYLVLILRHQSVAKLN